MIRNFFLHHPDGETRVLAGAGAVAASAEQLSEWTAGRTLFVVTTPRIWSLHGDRLRGLTPEVANRQVLEVEEGEAAKTLLRAGALWEAMLASGGKRDSRLIAFGGGSVGDLGGFVAGGFMRGIEVSQVPTTLLAQVDASLGGKTGIDLPAAKNSVGLFHHPRFVVSDTEVLRTLPREELAAGLAEVVKMAFLLDPALLERVEEELAKLLSGDGEALGPVVAAAAAAKIRVVERDPLERGERRLLNFGHTLGHALETVSGYSGLRHGEAVSYGMLFALRLAERRGLPAPQADRLRALIGRLELPPLPSLPVDRVVKAMEKDKKARQHGLVWVLPERLGQGRSVEGIDREEVTRELTSFLAEPR